MTDDGDDGDSDELRSVLAACFFDIKRVLPSSSSIHKGDTNVLGGFVLPRPTRPKPDSSLAHTELANLDSSSTAKI